jgi:hypothetical protein
MWFIITLIFTLPVVWMMVSNMEKLSKSDKSLEEFKKSVDDFDKGMEKYVEWLERNTKNGRH